MKKILIAGAGHAGLTAGMLLAKHGYDVTVFEKQARQALGHDWEDRFSFPLLCGILEIDEADLPKDSWRYRGDSTFVSPAKRTQVQIPGTPQTRQKIMWRKPLIRLLIEKAEQSGVRFSFETEVLGPIAQGAQVLGLRTAKGEVYGDLVIDAAGVFSPVRANLPAACGIERAPRYGDLFYARRVYLNKTAPADPAFPFEIYLYHNGQRGLSWCCTNEETVDILIGRIDRLSPEAAEEQIESFRREHHYIGTEIAAGGQFGVIPVRRPLTRMTAAGYAAAGDAAFMTTPMNGMGVDLSLQAGRLLAQCVLKAGDRPLTAEVLWKYNRDFHRLYGGDAAKNEGLKNAILSMPARATDFFFESGVIGPADLAGAGRNMNAATLIKKLANGMRQPAFFFGLLKGILRGARASALYKHAPEHYDPAAIEAWSRKIGRLDIRLQKEPE